MEHEDVQIGRILSRREVLGLLGAGGAAKCSFRSKRRWDRPTSH